MKKARFAVVSAINMFAFLVFLSGAARAMQFSGGIGVIPRANAAGTPNEVRGVQPAGQIWVIRNLQASVVNGQIVVNGKGLLLGGGNNIGLNGGASVFATIICETVPPFVEHSTPQAGVALKPNGNFTIQDALSPPLPPVCQSPALLIRNSANQGWFAAGIPELP